MVSKRKLKDGSNGYHATIIPKAPRSIRKREPRKDVVKDSKLCAFDLLAAVAGKLLLESESSASSNIAEGSVKLGVRLNENEKQHFVDDKPAKSESLDHGSCAESAFVQEVSIHENKPQAEKKSILAQASALSSSDAVKKVDCNIKVETSVEKAHEIPSLKLEASVRAGDNINCKVECGPEDDENHPAKASIVKDPIEECVNTNRVINSEDSVHLLLSSDPVPDGVLQKCLNDVDVGTRDDDENSSGCDKSSTKSGSFGPQPLGHNPIRKMLTYKHKKADLMVKDAGEGMKLLHEYRKRNYTLGRYQQAHVKKQKLSDCSSSVGCDQDNSSDSISNFPENGMAIATDSSVMVRGEEAKDNHVKFSIKSFKVPELCIEVPEDASLGSLKRAVMEAVTALFGNEFQVGVVLQGNMVRDDNKTLQEAGISDGTNLDTLGFTLEPSFTANNLPPLLPQDSDQELQRSPVDSGILDTQIDPPLVSRFDDGVYNSEFKSSPQTSTNKPSDGVVPDSKALVPVPPMNPDALAVVPVDQKPKRNEPSHRRTRRPFTVAEVEALVESVEKLGTGRWRDVKLGAFEHADHRTYVDLKDKWKTLVHTASISPQQRRGEPVPQELLDRVLAAHSYWSQHQSKQHGKQLPVDPLKSDDPRPETVHA